MARIRPGLLCPGDRGPAASRSGCSKNPGAPVLRYRDQNRSCSSVVFPRNKQKKSGTDGGGGRTGGGGLVRVAGYRLPEALQGAMGKDKLGGGPVEQPGMVFQDENIQSRPRRPVSPPCPDRWPWKSSSVPARSRLVCTFAGSGIDIGEGEIAAGPQRSGKFMAAPGCVQSDSRRIRRGPGRGTHPAGANRPDRPWPPGDPLAGLPAGVPAPDPGR